GETKTCTLTNNDIAPTLIVKKHVVNDNGGSASASAWSLAVKTGSALTNTPRSPHHGSESGATYHPDAGSYTVSESGGPSGYAFDGFPDHHTFPTRRSSDLGETKTCTLTNNDIAPTLIVKKHVINNNGGSASASAWSLAVKTG